MISDQTRSLDERITESLAAIDSIENDVRDLFARYTVVGEPIYTAHFLLWAAGHRTISQIRGFKSMIASRNHTCSSAIARMQLDTALRLWGGFMHGNLAAYAEHVHAGCRVQKLKSSAGLALTDRTLVNDLTAQYPWVARVYEATSGSIHLSSRHISLALHIDDEDPPNVSVQMGPEDRMVQPEIFFESCEAFLAITRLVLDVIDRWFANLGNTTGHWV